MKRVYISIIPLAVLLLMLSIPEPPHPPTLPAASAASPASVVETARIQAHLESVEQELLGRDVSHLSADQRAARARHIRVLREYRERGVFPHNHDFPGERVPYFADEHGTLCAMAYLIAESGREDLVERVAATRNNARIPELADDAELVAWLKDAGLSLDEAARIQPWYDGPGMIIDDEPNTVSASYAIGSALTSGLGGAMIALNLTSVRSEDGPRWPALVGLTTGVAGLALGIDKLGDGGTPALLGAVNTGIGALSATLGAWNLISAPADRAVGEAAEPSSRRVSVTAAPLVHTDSRGGAGVQFRVRF